MDIRFESPVPSPRNPQLPLAIWRILQPGPMEERSKISRFVVACVFTAPVAAVLAPLLFPIAMLLAPGFDGPVGWDLTGVLAIASFALGIALFVALVVGLPILLLLDRIGWNRPPILAIAGALVSCALFDVIARDSPSAKVEEIWPLYLYVGVIGAVCGAVASHNSLKNTGSD